MHSAAGGVCKSGEWEPDGEPVEEVESIEEDEE